MMEDFKKKKIQEALEKEIKKRQEKDNQEYEKGLGKLDFEEGLGNLELPSVLKINSRICQFKVRLNFIILIY